MKRRSFIGTLAQPPSFSRRRYLESVTWRSCGMSAGAGAVMRAESPRTVVNRARIAELGFKHRLPVMSQLSRLVEAGGLMSYRPDLSDLFGRAASYIDKILNGAKPADVPVAPAAGGSSDRVSDPALLAARGTEARRDD